MKKILASVLGVIFIFTSCGGGQGKDYKTENENKTIATEDSKAESDSQAEPIETITLEFGMTSGVQSNEYKAVEFLKEILGEKSNGALELNIFPDAQLGDDRAMIDQCIAGQLDITLGETGRLGLWLKEAELFQLPYVFDDYEDLRTSLFETEEGKTLIQKFEDELNIIFVDTAYNGTRQTSSNFPINSIEDMKGMKLRVPNAQANLEFATNIGASPTPMAFSEVYLALQTNAVDGQENPLSAIKSSKFYEVQSHIALTNHILNDQGYLVSKATFDTLTPELQNILMESIKEAVEYHTELFVEDEKGLIDFFEGEGVTITKPNMSKARAMMQPSYDRYLSESGDAGKALYDAIIGN
ncbi:MAG: sialic acid TRAP transporter substrate-binding protein SiaP [Lachnospirales bacterium]